MDDKEGKPLSEYTQIAEKALKSFSLYESLGLWRQSTNAGLLRYTFQPNEISILSGQNLPIIRVNKVFSEEEKKLLFSPKDLVIAIISGTEVQSDEQRTRFEYAQTGLRIETTISDTAQLLIIASVASRIDRDTLLREIMEYKQKLNSDEQYRNETGYYKAAYITKLLQLLGPNDWNKGRLVYQSLQQADLQPYASSDALRARNQLADAENAKAMFRVRIEALQQRTRQLEEDLKKANADNISIREALASAQAKISSLEEDNAKLRQKLSSGPNTRRDEIGDAFALLNIARKEFEPLTYERKLALLTEKKRRFSQELHPDLSIFNDKPILKRVAGEELKELNRAYDIIYNLYKPKPSVKKRG